MKDTYSISKNIFRWIAISFYFLILGCSQMSWNEEINKFPTHQEILTGKLAQTTLVDRTLFMTFLPIDLMALKNKVDNRIEDYCIKTNNGLDSKNNNVCNDHQKTEKLIPPSEPHTRISTIELTNNSEPPDWRKIRVALLDSCKSVRMSTIQSLKDLSSPPDWKVMEMGLEDTNEFIRMVSVQVIVLFPDENGVKLIKRALKDPSPFVRGEAAKGLAKFPSNIALPLLWSILQDETGYVREQAKDSLVKLTGHDIGFAPYGSLEKRLDMSKTWENWWNDRNRQYSKETDSYKH